MAEAASPTCCRLLYVAVRSCGLRPQVRTHPDMHFFTGDCEESELHRQVRSLEGRVPPEKVPPEKATGVRVRVRVS